LVLRKATRWQSKTIEDISWQEFQKIAEEDPDPERKLCVITAGPYLRLGWAWRERALWTKEDERSPRASSE
jgi:hypothetical protein